jgi:hypothetical protein
MAAKKLARSACRRRKTFLMQPTEYCSLGELSSRPYSPTLQRKAAPRFGLPYAGHGVRVHVLSAAQCVAMMGVLDLEAPLLIARTASNLKGSLPVLRRGCRRTRVYAVEVLPWPRCDAEASLGRCYLCRGWPETTLDAILHSPTLLPSQLEPRIVPALPVRIKLAAKRVVAVGSLQR